MSTPYVPDCDIVEQDDGSFLVIHLDSGRGRIVDNARRALIVGTGIAVAYTWRMATR